jgi:hypothetical protein
MTVATDYADPCAVLPRIREAYYALLEGRRAELVEFDAGNGVRRRVQYGPGDIAALRAELSRLEDAVRQPIRCPPPLRTSRGRVLMAATAPSSRGSAAQYAAPHSSCQGGGSSCGPGRQDRPRWRPRHRIGDRCHPLRRLGTKGERPVCPDACHQRRRDRAGPRHAGEPRRLARQPLGPDQLRGHRRPDTRCRRRSGGPRDPPRRLLARWRGGRDVRRCRPGPRCSSDQAGRGLRQRYGGLGGLRHRQRRGRDRGVADLDPRLDRRRDDPCRPERRAGGARASSPRSSSPAATRWTATRSSRCRTLSAPISRPASMPTTPVRRPRRGRARRSSDRGCRSGDGGPDLHRCRGGCPRPRRSDGDL